MAFGVTFILSMITWIVLSARFDAFHLGLGVVAALIVANTSARTLFPGGHRDVRRFMRVLPGAVVYLFWLLKQVVIANLHVFYLAMHTEMIRRIEPQLVRFKTILTTDFAKFVFANSITLTPGTVVIRIDDDEFLVHAISHQSASGLPGEMEQRIAAVFEAK